MPAETEIDALFAAWREAVVAKDIETIASFVTEDCEFWTHAAPPLLGRDALRTTLKAFYASFDHRQDFERLELVTAENIAFVRGIERNYIRAASGGPEVQRFQRAFMLIRKEADGNWRFARGMTNLPPEEPPASAKGAHA